MKRSRLFLVVGAVLAALAVAVVLLEPTFVLRGYLRQEKFYAGRPVSYWRQALSGADPAAQVDAMKKFGEADESAVPVLVALLSEKNESAWKTVEARWKAADLLRQLGPKARDAAPALIEALGDDDLHVRTLVATSLGAMTPPPKEAEAPLIAALARGDRSSAAAARALSAYKAEARGAIPALLKALQAREAEVRWNAARTLGKIGPEAKTAVPALLEAMKDEESKVREHAAEAMGDIGPGAIDSVPALIAILKDTAPRVRRDAARSLGQIGPAANLAVPALKGLLKDEDEMVRQAATKALRILDGGAAKGNAS